MVTESEKNKSRIDLAKIYCSRCKGVDPVLQSKMLSNIDDLIVNSRYDDDTKHAMYILVAISCAEKKCDYVKQAIEELISKYPKEAKDHIR